MPFLSRWTSVASVFLLTACGGGGDRQNSFVAPQAQMAESTQALATTPIIFGRGTAVIDGVVATGEWAMANCAAITVNVPQGTTAGMLCAMNDAQNMYLMVRYPRPPGDAVSQVWFEFDTDHSGSVSHGDDVFGAVAWPAETRFNDDVRWACGAQLCGPADVDLGGTVDGAGAFANDGSVATFELSHPLKSGDIHDFSLNVGDSIEVRMTLGFAPTPTSLQTETSVLATMLVSVPIDIGREEINSRSNALVPVSILSTPTFNASVSVDANSLTFGRTGEEGTLSSCRPQDVNDDGIVDLACELHARATGYQAGDTIGILRGTKPDGTPLAGVTPVRVR